MDGQRGKVKSCPLYRISMIVGPGKTKCNYIIFLTVFLLNVLPEF